MQTELDEGALEQLAAGRAFASGCRRAACQAIRFARRYRAEEHFERGAREQACVAEALSWRRRAREAITTRCGPGLARAGLAVATETERRLRQA